MQFDSEEFSEGMKKIGEDLHRKMREIDEEYEKRRKKTNRKFLKIILPILFLFIFLNVKNAIMLNTTNNFKKYSIDYCYYLKHDLNNNNITVYDRDIIYNKLLPYFGRSFVNPFEWTELQISKDDELLKKCKEVYNIKEKERQEEEKEAKETFNERIREND